MATGIPDNGFFSDQAHTVAAKIKTDYKQLFFYLTEANEQAHKYLAKLEVNQDLKELVAAALLASHQNRAIPSARNAVSETLSRHATVTRAASTMSKQTTRSTGCTCVLVWQFSAANRVQVRSRPLRHIQRALTAEGDSEKNTQTQDAITRTSQALLRPHGGNARCAIFLRTTGAGRSRG